jgi:hypothetical protein
VDVGESYVQALPRIDSGFEQWVGTSSPAREQARHLPSDAPSGSRGRLDPHSPRPTVGNCGTRLFSAERFFHNVHVPTVERGGAGADYLRHAAKKAGAVR